MDRRLSTTQRRKDRKLVSSLIGRELRVFEVVHHHTDRVFILCKDQPQHKLVHQEMDALDTCGYKDWRRCKFCGKYDDPSNLYIYRTGDACHRKCSSEHRRLSELCKAARYASALGITGGCIGDRAEN